MEIGRVLRILDKLAPLKLAAKWDNVGLLVEPSSPHIVNHIFLTNDLTEPVMNEAVQWKADMIISYHPPIFAPVKRLTTDRWKDRLVIKALEKRIAIYSPHTACDAAYGGVNDWLAKGLADEVKSSPIEKSYANAKKLVKLKVEDEDEFFDFVKALEEKFEVLNRTNTKSDQLEFICDDVDQLFSIFPTLSMNDMQVINLDSKPIAQMGMGRLCHLPQVTLQDLINRIKSHLLINNVRLALGVGSTLDSKITTVALCAGSGASILRGVAADVYLTGEMSHHEVLDAVANKTSVILCEHSNTERGFLKEFAQNLTDELENDSIKVKVSDVDRDPLEVF